MSEWKPISEHDGTSGYVMCGSDGSNDDSDGWVFQGWWSADYKAWYEAGSHPTDAHDGMIYPTHYMPLPSPPTGAQE